MENSTVGFTYGDAAWHREQCDKEFGRCSGDCNQGRDCDCTGSDLVKRLRNVCDGIRWADGDRLYDDAAEEIEKLRKKVQEQALEMLSAGTQAMENYDESVKLQKELAEAKQQIAYWENLNRPIPPDEPADLRQQQSEPVGLVPCRIDFENWYGPEYSSYALTLWDGLKYGNLDTELAWQSWQASAKLYAAPPAQSESERDALYNELIYAVGNKYPGETRHQTALRYIRRAEELKEGAAKQEGKK